MPRPRVFIVQEVMRRDENDSMVPAYDLTPAAAYGDLVPLLPSGWQGVSLNSAVETLREKLEDFTTEDYLLPLGDPALMIAAGMIAAMQTTGFVKVLRWDRKQRTYLPATIDLPDF